MHVRDAYLFRVTRDADLDLQEDEADDLLREIESELQRRRFGEPVRLNSGARDAGISARLPLRCARSHRRRLLRRRRDDGPERFGRSHLPGYDQLRDKPFMPAIPKRLIGVTDMFAAIREGDILLHHPYDSFDPIVQFFCSRPRKTRRCLRSKRPCTDLRQELADHARFAWLLRTKNRWQWSSSSKRDSTRKTISSGRAGWSAGAHVVYGFANQKVHAKTLLVVREDDDGLRRYMHFGTGNYNEKSARLYTDVSLFTCLPELGADIAQLFNALTGFSKITDYEELWVAPVTLRRELTSMIERETEHAKAGRPGRHSRQTQPHQRCRHHPRVVSRVASRGFDRSARARNAVSRRSGAQRANQSAHKHRGTFPRTFTNLCVRKWRRPRSLHRECRLDGA